MSAQPDPQAVHSTPTDHDIDLQETREWMEALSAVIEKEGPERAHFLLEQLLEHARQSSIDLPFAWPFPAYAPHCAACHANDFRREGDHIGGDNGTVAQNQNCGQSG